LAQPIDLRLDQRCIDAIRALAMDAVEQAQSGHPGTPMALAPAAYVLWTRYLRHNPANPDWPDRDRFILSAGHASMLLYAMLHLTGYEVTLEDIRNFRQFGSRTPGHPERGHTRGVEVTTGPLGQGVGNSVGMGIATRILSEKFNRPDFPMINHRIWVFASDGDLMEGVASEASSLAGHLRLGNLKMVYDDNRITIDGETDIAFTEDRGKRYEAYGWKVLHVKDGNNLAEISAAYDAAIAETGRPVIIIMRTVIADPAPTKRNTPEAHGAPLGAEEVKRTKEIMGWSESPFGVPDDVRSHMLDVKERGREQETTWQTLRTEYAKSHSDLAQELDLWLSGRLPQGWDARLPVFAPRDGKLATRQASQSALNALASSVTNLVGGSADLATSTGTTIKDGGAMGPESTGRNIHWGVREHAMGSCLNGLMAHGGLRGFGSTFLIFFDYMKPAVRLAALSRLPVIFIGSHDSIGLGEDGPTHQPIEQLAMLRAMPNVVTIRPADANETVEAWRIAMERTDGPTVLVLSRQKLPVIDRSTAGPASGLRQGGYIVSDPDGAEGILISTGSEVHIAMEAAKLLAAEGIKARVVSLPSWDLFEAQPATYRDQVLPPALTTRVAIEAAATFGWSRYVGPRGTVLGLDHFGASAPAEDIYREFGLTAERMADEFKRLRGTT
jgi:transketolase